MNTGKKTFVRCGTTSLGAKLDAPTVIPARSSSVLNLNTAQDAAELSMSATRTAFVRVAVLPERKQLNGNGAEKEKSKEVSAGGKSEHQKSAGVHPRLSLHMR